MKYVLISLLLLNPLLAYAQRPTMPEYFQVTDKTSEYISFSWSTVADAVGYRLYRNTQPLLSVVGTQIADGAVEESAVYGYTISAYNDLGESAQSEILLVRVPDGTGPVVSSIFPRENTRVAVGVKYLTFVTNEKATCFFSTGESEFTTTGGSVHIAPLALESGTTKDIDFSCADRYGNERSYDYQFEVASSMDVETSILLEVQTTLDTLTQQVAQLVTLMEMHISTTQ